MRFIAPIADRMLSLVAPKVSAAALINCGPGYAVACGPCVDRYNIQSIKTCQYEGTKCQLQCTACYTSSCL
jgi:hypothetical protein